MAVEERHQLDRRAARLDQASLIFVEGVLADLEQSARLPLRQLKLGAQAPDRFWRWHAVRLLLETAKRLVDDGHVLADVDALAFARIASRRRRRRGQRLSVSENIVSGSGSSFVAITHFSLNETTVNSVSTSA